MDTIYKRNAGLDLHSTQTHDIISDIEKLVSIISIVERILFGYLAIVLYETHLNYMKITYKSFRYKCFISDTNKRYLIVILHDISIVFEFES